MTHGLELDIDRLPDFQPGMSFDIWEADEPEFEVDGSRKFSALLHPLDMALGTDGKNDHLAREGVSVLASWALPKLFVGCVKVAAWCGWEIVKRKFERRPSC